MNASDLYRTVMMAEPPTTDGPLETAERERLYAGV